MKGRKAIPDRIKQLTGRRIRNHAPGDAVEYTLATDGAAPEHLDDVAAAEWLRLSGELRKTGVLAVTDLAALAAYCRAVSNAIEAQKNIEENGMVIPTLSGAMKNPACSVLKDCDSTIARLASEFGFTPASRSKVRTGGGGDDKLQEFIDGCKRSKRAV